jgi:hypothetical protein
MEQSMSLKGRCMYLMNGGRSGCLSLCIDFHRHLHLLSACWSVVRTVFISVYRSETQ